MSDRMILWKGFEINDKGRYGSGGQSVLSVADGGLDARRCHLPTRTNILFFLHHVGHQSVVGPADYWTGYYSLVIAFHVIRLLVMALAGVWFWKGGPVPERLFGGTSETIRSETVV